MNIKVLGIDLAKNVFQLHGADDRGNASLRKKVRRGQLMETIANLPSCTIVMEACGGSNHWGRKFEQMGHQVKLISPQYVKPFVRGNKTDRNDAQAIVEAASRPEMRYVQIKSKEHQDIQNIHSVRSRLIGQRTALSNQIRGILTEYGICIAKGFSSLRKRIAEILEDGENELTAQTRILIADLYEEFIALNKRIEKYDKQIDQLFRENEACQRIGKIEGIGPIVATAVISRLGDAKHFKNGRHFAAYLGLVPKQYSSGGKERLLGISKRGDKYLRTLLIHGARSALRQVDRKIDKRSLWSKGLKERRGANKAAVALANKNARIIWSLIAHNENYHRS